MPSAMQRQNGKRKLGLVIMLLLIASWVACRSSNLPPPTKKEAPAPQPAQTATVCIDPGHPSEVNSGTTVQNGTTEVHIAWVVALKLQRILEAQGLKVVMTKSREDQLVTNKERAFIANASDAVFMVRLHCDAGEDEGLALYFPDRQATKDGVTGPSEEVIGHSKDLAETIHVEMSKALSGTLKDGGVRGDSKTFIGSKQGVLTASIFSEVPIVTIEMVVLSNRTDAEFIKSEAGQEKMAQAIANGIRAFIAGAH